jgi:hypothetical protein
VCVTAPPAARLDNRRSGTDATTPILSFENRGAVCAAAHPPVHNRRNHLRGDFLRNCAARTTRRRAGLISIAAGIDKPRVKTSAVVTCVTFETSTAGARECCHPAEFLVDERESSWSSAHAGYRRPRPS